MLELTCTHPVSVTSMDTKLAGKGQPGKTRGCFECLLDAGGVGGWAQLEEKGRSLKACASYKTICTASPRNGLGLQPEREQDEETEIQPDRSLQSIPHPAPQQNTGFF